MRMEEGRRETTDDQFTVDQLTVFLIVIAVVNVHVYFSFIATCQLREQLKLMLHIFYFHSCSLPQS